MENKMNAVILDGYTENPGDLNWDYLESVFNLTVYDRTPPEKVLERSKDADVLIVNKVAITREILKNLPKLKFVATLATGFNQLDTVALRERNFDEDGVIEITPGVYSIFKNNLVELKTNNDELIKKGVVGMYDNFKVIMSNGLANDGTKEYCDVRGKKAIAFAGQINEVEAGRMERRFADYIRGLDTFGSKVIDDSRMQVIEVPVA